MQFSILSFICPLFLHFNMSIIVICLLTQNSGSAVGLFLLCFILLFFLSSNFWLNILFMYKRTVVAPYQRFLPFSVMQMEHEGDYLDSTRDWARLGSFQYFSVDCWSVLTPRAGSLGLWLRVWSLSSQSWSLKIQLFFPSVVFSLTLYPPNSYNFTICKWAAMYLKWISPSGKSSVPKHCEITETFSRLLEVLGLLPHVSV